MNLVLLAATAAAKAVPSAAATTLPRGAVAPNVPVAAPEPMQQTPIAMHVPWLTHTLAGIFIVAAVAMIALLAIQTTKQEGLTGTIGGRVESAYRGRLGADEQLKRWTGIAAVTFVVVAFFLSLTGI
ncbi:MAG TPA: preprotein translocase subunit SecG [Candidatus Cybelea sp.]|nr:preprotein translocase subunit SecG [Candidatus Cybelea sp.]